MLRDKSLIPLSHQHQHALALCVRIDRAQPIAVADLHAWQTEIGRDFANEIKVHFSVEEQVLFPAARQFAELIPLIDELITDHASLREYFRQAETRNMSAGSLPIFAQQLSTHIRKEERRLFERLQELLTPNELAALGGRLEAALRDAPQSCVLTNEATRLKPKNKLR
jgi:hemerythrin-like domain-containing protein